MRKWKETITRAVFFGGAKDRSSPPLLCVLRSEPFNTYIYGFGHHIFAPVAGTLAFELGQRFIHTIRMEPPWLLFPSQSSVQFSPSICAGIGV